MECLSFDGTKCLKIKRFIKSETVKTTADKKAEVRYNKDRNQAFFTGAKSNRYQLDMHTFGRRTRYSFALKRSK